MTDNSYRHQTHGKYVLSLKNYNVYEIQTCIYYNAKHRNLPFLWPNPEEAFFNVKEFCKYAILNFVIDFIEICNIYDNFYVFMVKRMEMHKQMF